MRFDIERKIEDWKTYLHSHGGFLPEDIEELETHLRDKIDVLRENGLDAEESYFIGIKRLGKTDTLSREFYKINAQSLWKHLFPPSENGRGKAARDVCIIVGLALLAGLLGKIPDLFGYRTSVDSDSSIYLRNVYYLSARTGSSKAVFSDYMVFFLILVSLLADIIALHAIISRLRLFGVTPNKAAALGENVLPFINLLGLAFTFGKVVFSGGSYRRLETWQSWCYLAFMVWTAVVVFISPPRFSFHLRMTCRAVLIRLVIPTIPIICLLY